jgi:hypothetical protein
MAEQIYTVFYVDSGRVEHRRDNWRTLFSVCFYRGTKVVRRQFASGESDVVNWLGGGPLEKQPSTQYVRVYEHIDDEDLAEVGTWVQIYTKTSAEK